MKKGLFLLGLLIATHCFSARPLSWGAKFRIAAYSAEFVLSVTMLTTLQCMNGAPTLHTAAEQYVTKNYGPMSYALAFQTPFILCMIHAGKGIQADLKPVIEDKKSFLHRLLKGYL